jgi:hypothetical protein
MITGHATHALAFLGIASSSTTWIWVRRTFDFFVHGTLVRADADIPFQRPFNWISLRQGNSPSGSEEL